MGNSVEVIRNHYKKTLDPLVAEEFWKIVPIEQKIDGDGGAKKIATETKNEETPTEDKEINGNNPIQELQRREEME